jgi:hypothetical protein
MISSGQLARPRQGNIRQEIPMTRAKQVMLYRAGEQGIEEAEMPAMDARQVLQRHGHEWFAERSEAEKALEARLRA